MLLAQRWIVARLRNSKFFSLSELNEAIAELLEDLNARPFKRLEGCRRSAFESIDLPAMRPLPALRYELRERRKVGVNIDYHVEFDFRHYSVSHTLIGQQVEVRATASIVEIFRNNERIASHPRSYGRRGTPVTCDAHRPLQHEHRTWPPERMIEWASTFGPAVATVVERTLAQYVHPDQGYRACLGLLRVAQKHGAERMDAACALALTASISRAPHRKYIEAILRLGLDREQRSPAATRAAPLEHDNVRGGEYYDRKEIVH